MSDGCDLVDGRCLRCGWINYTGHNDIEVFRQCPAIKGVATPQPGPGTRLKNFLTKWGVTEEWYKSLKEKVGLIPECNCEMRAAYMDAVWKGYQTGGWEAAKIEYTKIKSYYDRPQ